ncbi:hypothetical protein FACS1894110_03240 [Spirochaetia bacterium]|nr:hypothetical protein FACS1894110_03240 [Spirochaetia bacterium]
MTGKSPLFFLVLFMALSSLRAADYTEGRIRLTLDENTGRFSLYYMTDVTKSQYEPLFASQDPRIGLLTVNLNDEQYRLGDSDSFTVRIGGSQINPSLIFESPVLTITEEFFFIKTTGSPAANGVKITLKAENKSSRSADVGLHLLLDTGLGEDGTITPFITDLSPIPRVTIFSGTSVTHDAAAIAVLMDSTTVVQADLNNLQSMIARINAYVHSGILIGDEDLAVLEREILQLQSRYGK